MLDAMAGYDPADPITAFSLGKIPKSYIPFLDANGLKGARIGLLIDFMGKDAVHKEVNAVVQAAAKKMEEMDTTVIPLSIPNLAQLTDNIAVSNFEFKSAFNKYLTSLGSNAPVKSLDEFIADGKFHPSIKKDITGDQAIQDGMNQQEYKSRMLRREALRQAVMAVMADHRLDAILYPHQRRLVAAIGEDQLERNGVSVQQYGLSGYHLPRWLLRAHSCRATRGAHRYRAVRTGMVGGNPPQVRLRLRTRRQDPQTTGQHTTPCSKAVALSTR